MSDNNLEGQPIGRMSQAIEIHQLSVHFGFTHAIRDISMKIPPKTITALIGAPGSGKTSLLRSINRLNELIANCTTTGGVLLNGSEIYDDNCDLEGLRRRCGYVFPEAQTFPRTVFDNVCWAARPYVKTALIEQLVEESLREAELWDEVKDKLLKPALTLSPGQKQRLCIARILSLKPEVLLLDRPNSSLDALSAGKIEDLLLKLKHKYTIVLSTGNLQRASRLSQFCAFLQDGELVEFGPTGDLFFNPQENATEQFLCRS